MTAISKNVYFDVLDDIINKYNNAVHRSIKMKPIDVTDDSYAEYKEDSNKKDPKFKVGDHKRTMKCKIIFSWTYVISDLKKLIEVFMKKYCKKLVKKNLE